MWLPFSPMAIQPLGFTPLQLFGIYPCQAYAPPGAGLWPIPGVYTVVVPSTTSCKLFNCPTAIQSIWWGKQLLGLGRESPSPSAFLTCWGGAFSSCFFPSDDMADSESVVGI